MRANNRSPDDVISAIGQELDKTIVEVVDCASRDVAKLDDGFFVFAVALDKIVFVKADGGDFWKSANSTDETLIIDGTFDFVDNVISKSSGFGVSAVGRGIATNAVTNGINIFSGSFKITINSNAGVCEFDFGVL